MRVTPEAVKSARLCGVYGQTEKRIRRMAKRSARITCEFGNRRFGDFVLDVVGDDVRGVQRVSFAR